MDPEDQVTVRFYDSTLTTIYTTRGSISLEPKNLKPSPPYVQAALGGGGRGVIRWNLQGISLFSVSEQDPQPRSSNTVDQSRKDFERNPNKEGCTGPSLVCSERPLPTPMFP